MSTRRFLAIAFSVGLLGSTAHAASSYAGSLISSEPAAGGGFTVLMPGRIASLHPLLSLVGSNDKTLSPLLFSGLLRLNPQSNTYEPDLATGFSRSDDGLTYTVTLRNDLFWHDGRSITAADIIYTYGFIASPEFPRRVFVDTPVPRSLEILSAVFKKVEVTKIDDKTVRFTLPERNNYFASYLALPLAPAHIWATVPAGEVLGYPASRQPVGSGPYMYKDFVVTDGIPQLQLQRYSRYHGAAMPPETVSVYFYNGEAALAARLRQGVGYQRVDGLPESAVGQLQDTMGVYRIVDPAYYGLFFNMESSIASSKPVRQALALALDKDALATGANLQRIDLPTTVYGGKYLYQEQNQDEARRKLSDAGYTYLTTTELQQRLQRVLAQAGTTPQPTATKSPYAPAELLRYSSEAEVIVSGLSDQGLQAVYVNGYKLTRYNPDDGNWRYLASAALRNIKEGDNVFTIEGDIAGKRTPIATATVVWAATPEKLQQLRAAREPQAAAPAPQPTSTTPDATSASTLRFSPQGRECALRTLYPEGDARYTQLLQQVDEQLRAVGCALDAHPATGDAFANALAARDFDVLLYQQQFPFTPDLTPYWHSSQTTTGNYSGFANVAADKAIDDLARGTGDNAAAEEFARIFAEEQPAVLLGSPARLYAAPREWWQQYPATASGAATWQPLSAAYLVTRRTLLQQPSFGGFWEYMQGGFSSGK